MDSNSHSRTGWARDAAWLVSLALLCRVAFMAAMPRVIDTADAIHYIEAAKHLRAGDFFGFNAKIPVLYPMLAAVAHLGVGDFEWACYLVSVLASSLLVLPVYWLSRDMHGRGAARMAGVAAAIWPWLIDWGYRIGPDALGCTLWFLSIWLMWRGVARGGLWPVAAAMAFFALHLTRAEGTMLMATAPVAALLLCVRGGEGRARRLLPFLVTAGVLLGAYTVYMRYLTGTASVNYRAHFIVEEFVFWRMAVTAVKTVAEVVPVMLGPALLLFLGVGFFQADTDPQAPPRRPRLELFVLMFAGVQWLANISVLSAEPRYLMSVIVALSMWSSRGVVLVSRMAVAQPLGPWLRLLPAASVVGLMLLGSAITLAAEHLHRQPGQPYEYKTVGLWMKENVTPGLVFTRKPQIGYYAEMPSTGPDLKDTIPQAIDRAKAAGAKYVVVDERYTTQMVPALAPLLDPALAPPDLKCLKTFAPYPQSRVVVYELVTAPGAAEQ